MINFDPAQVLAAAKASKSFAMTARFWTGKLILNMNDEAYVLEVVDGVPTDFRRDDALLSGEVALGECDIVVSGPAASWDKLLSKVPPPGFHDAIFGAGGAGFSLAGNGITAIGPFYWPAQEFIMLLRQVRNGSPEPEALPEVDREFDAAVGRYMYIHVQGTQYRIYYEEAGDGDIPLIMLHTAGADSRQWRHVMEDPDYQKMYRMIAYDLPFHGRSLPPTSVPWWHEQYRLSRSFLMDTIIAISKRLGLERPVFMGCSIGGLLAPDLAYYHSDDFRAVIGLNSGLGLDPEMIEMVEANFAVWSNPRVGAQWTTALNRAQLAPTSPEPYRRETTFVYSQGTPALNEGDLFYYARDHDLTAEQASQIDTSRTAVYLITGGYDGLAFPGGTDRLANAIKGCHYEVVHDLGHFGPAENPDECKAALLPILQEIAAKSLVEAG